MEEGMGGGEQKWITPHLNRSTELTTKSSPARGEEINFRKLFSEQIVSWINGELLFNDSLFLKEADGTRMKGDRHPFIGILQEDRLELHMDRIQF